jgi:hypothetical protein
MRKLGRPQNEEPSQRMTLTLAPEDHDLVKAYAHQVGMKPATVVSRIVLDTLKAGMDENGGLDAGLVNENLRKLHGTDEANLVTDPRWRWPLDALLTDRRWWDRLLPHLHELLGRGSLIPSKGRGRPGERESAVTDRRGYANLMEYLYPAKNHGDSVTTWRDPIYGAAFLTPDDQVFGPDAEVWEATIRHVAMALDALDETLQPGANALYRIQVQEHITGPWLRALSYITGKGKPEPLPESRLA